MDQILNRNIVWAPGSLITKAASMDGGSSLSHTGEWVVGNNSGPSAGKGQVLLQRSAFGRLQTCSQLGPSLLSPSPLVLLSFPDK